MRSWASCESFVPGALRLRCRIAHDEPATTWVDPSQESRELALIFGAFVFLPMLLVAVLAFFGRETLGATALGLLSFSWLARALVEYVGAPDPTSSALGTLDLVLTLVLLCLGAIGLLNKLLLSVVILPAFFRYGLKGLYEFHRERRRAGPVCSGAGCSTLRGYPSRACCNRLPSGRCIPTEAVLLSSCPTRETGKEPRLLGPLPWLDQISAVL
jgi:hypothetical protein